MRPDLFKGPARALKTILCLLMIALALSCSKPAPEIVGTWDNAKAPESVEFRPDGTGTFIYTNQQNPPLNFTWRQTEQNKYLLNIDFMGSKKVLMGTVKEKALNLEGNMGTEMYNKHIKR
ncbi:MAG TPA: hypothetical protein VGJ93_01285 [Desulfuromonadaceae bacterium]|jgi:outer membrane biogenesis lipoprotein LolB